jgi:hypothetical protein
MTDKQQFQEWLGRQTGFLHEPTEWTAWTAWLAATKAEKERNRLEMKGIINTIATHANDLSHLANNLTRQHEK